MAAPWDFTSAGQCLWLTGVKMYEHDLDTKPGTLAWIYRRDLVSLFADLVRDGLVTA